MLAGRVGVGYLNNVEIIALHDIFSFSRQPSFVIKTSCSNRLSPATKAFIEGCEKKTGLKKTSGHTSYHGWPQFGYWMLRGKVN